MFFLPLTSLEKERKLKANIAVIMIKTHHKFKTSWQDYVDTLGGFCLL